MSPARSVSMLVAALVAAALLTGCAGARELLHHGARPSPSPKTDAGRSYLAQLTAAQARLTTAERAIPADPHTPAQLARSISLLGGAMHALAAGLTAITPPAQVARLHRRLIAITVAYERSLGQLAARAHEPQREVAAATALASATELASTSFTSTSAAIRERVAR